MPSPMAGRSATRSRNELVKYLLEEMHHDSRGT
jgi:hypothetical protein